MYMSPEQAMAKRMPLDHRTDIYSLGATLYQVLVRRPPFDGDTLAQLCSSIMTRDPVMPRRIDAHIPRDLETIVLKTLEKDRDLRYQSAGDLAEDLSRFSVGETIRARPIGYLGRTVRRVKRHKLVSTLLLATVLLAMVGGMSMLRAGREADLRHHLEYDRLLARAEEVMATSREASSDEKRAQSVTNSEAVDLLRQAIELVPERPEAYWLRSLVASRDRSARSDDIEAAGRRGLARRTWHMTRAQLLEDGRRFDAADLERQLAEQEPHTPQSTYFAGVLLARANRHEEAKERLTEALLGAQSSRHLRYLVHRQRAGVYERMGDFPKAFHDSLSLQELGFNPVSLQVRIAYQERKLGRRDVADRKFEAILKSVGRQGSAAAWGDLCAHCRNARVAAWRDRATAGAIAAHPEDTRIVRERILALNDAEQHEEALTLAQQAVKRHPDVHMLRAALAQVRFASGDHEEARKAFEHSLRLKPVCFQCLLGHARAHYELGDLDSAIESWQKAIEAEPRASAGYYNLALDYQGTGQLDTQRTWTP